MKTRFNQVKIYTRTCFNVFFNDRGWKVFISAAIITLIICSVTSSDMFAEYRATQNGAFALVCACIWIGIFNSIQSICKERAIIKREHRSGMHISSYITSHLIFEMVLCIAEAVIVTAVICFANRKNLPDKGVILPTAVELLITFFLIIFSSDSLGLMVSSIVKTPNTAMTVMPFVLIVQLVMSGMIFELKGFTEKIAKLTVAKWGLNAICITSDINSLPALIPLEKTVDEYKHTAGNLGKMWVILILFTLLYAVIAVISLKFIDKDKR